MTNVATGKSTRLKKIFNRKGDPVVQVTAPTPLGAKLLVHSSSASIITGMSTAFTNSLAMRSFSSWPIWTPGLPYMVPRVVFPPMKTYS